MDGKKNTAFLALALMLRMAASASDFTLVLFPDTQNYMTARNQEVWLSQCRWVARNRDAYGIEAVLGLGDVTSHASADEFAMAAQGYDIVEQAGIRALPIIGNKDYKKGPRNRSARAFDAFLESRHLADMPGYGGNFEGSWANYFVTLDAGGMSFLVLALELFPRAEVVDWAGAVMDANPDRRVIVLTHAYLDPSGRRTSAFGLGGPRNLGFWPSARGLSGEELWERLIRQKPNVLAVICGHQHPGKPVYRADAGVAGNIVHQFFINYQDAPHGGDGWIGLMQFHGATQEPDFRSFRSRAP